LRVFFRMNPDRDNIPNYSIWGVVVTEVEVDILTGEMRTVRTDLIEDAGLSTSPQVAGFSLPSTSPPG
jgi:xanthine dehydrogenase molybdopterin-binding subunit B